MSYCCIEHACRHGHAYLSAPAARLDKGRMSSVSTIDQCQEVVQSVFAHQSSLSIGDDYCSPLAHSLCSSANYLAYVYESYSLLSLRRLTVASVD